MTQIITVITQEYALLASDRRLTFIEGPKRGQLYDDDTCKLVSLCNDCGIAYSGLAHIEGRPTHEWIARTLASANCSDPGSAIKVLVEHAGRAFTKMSPVRHHTFMLSGWSRFTVTRHQPTPVSEDLGFRSFYSIISNCLDAQGRVMAKPRNTFDRWDCVLRADAPLTGRCIGHPLRTGRAERLERNIRRMIERDIGPKEILRVLVDEIICTATHESPLIGSKVLGLCIPKESLGKGFLLAGLPRKEHAAFTYFDPTYSDLIQYGPTWVCGQYAHTDFTGVKDPSDKRNQKVSIKILSVPKDR